MDQKPLFAPFSVTAPVFGSATGNPFLTPFASDVEAAEAQDAVWSHDTGDADDAAGAPTPTREAVDVRILWGTTVLHFEQMAPVRLFTLGGGDADFTLPESGWLPGDASFPLVTPSDDKPRVTVPEGATVDLKLVSGSVLSLQDCVAQRIATPSVTVARAMEVDLPHGATLTLKAPGSDLTFEIVRSRAREQPGAGLLAGADLTSQMYTGLSALAHLAVIGSLAFFLPPMHADDAEALDRETAAAMMPYLDAIAEKEPERVEAVAELDQSTPNGGGSGAPAEGPSGKMGSSVSRATDPARYAIAGDVKDTKLARDRAMLEAAKFGMVGLLNTDAPTGANTPIAKWGEDSAVGHDPSNALGVMWASTIGDAAGADGLGLSGTGEGGGGLSHGIGIDGIGSTVGHGTGDLGDGPGRGPGHELGQGGRGGSPRGLRGHDSSGPRVRPEPLTTFNGTLPREVVQRIVRQNFGRFRLCYEGGLLKNPGLTGRVAVAFVIDRNGGVAVASADRSTDMADPEVVSCVVRGFMNLSFPAPKDGTVQVIYPLMLAPGE
jgi:hypothetical protein